MTTKEKILEVMKIAGKPLAIHQFGDVEIKENVAMPFHARHWIGASENALAARLRELRRDGFVTALPPPQGKRFKEWALTLKGIEAVKNPEAVVG